MSDNINEDIGEDMLGPIGSNLMAILKVLTPAEIDRYSELELNAEPVVMQIAAGAENLSMSYSERDTNPEETYQDQLKHEIEEQKTADIIPINDSIKLEEGIGPPEPEEIYQKHDTKPRAPDGGLESIGVFNSSKVRELAEHRKALKDKNKESTTVFILDQREKFKKVQAKLQEQVAIIEYRKNAAQEFIKIQLTEEDLKEGVEPRTSTSCGVLINKRHY